MREGRCGLRRCYIAPVGTEEASGTERRLPVSDARERLLTAVRQTTAPIMLIQADNDYSTAAGHALSAELDRMHKPHLLEIYRAVGQTPEDGHNAVYSAIPTWEPDVFKFLDEYVGPQ